jgi:4-amino-4-deoxychorismate lyase
LRYGDGVFETFRLRDGRPLLWRYHEDRLQAGLDALGIALAPGRVAESIALAKAHLDRHGIADAAGRLQVTRGEGERGYRSGDSTPNVLMSLHPAITLRADRGPVDAMLCKTSLACQPRLAGIKHCNRLEQVLAAQELEQCGVEEGIQLSSDGHLVCAVSSNLFLVRDGEVLTPELSRCGIAGTVRRLLLEELLPARGVQARETLLLPEDLDTADELFFSNALQGIRSVAAVGDRRFTCTEWGDTLQRDFLQWCESGA